VNLTLTSLAACGVWRTGPDSGHLPIAGARRRRGRALAASVSIAGLIAIAASGCTSSPATTVPHDQARPACETRAAKTLPASYLSSWGGDTGISWASFAREFPGMIRPPSSQADLIGPHSVLLPGGEVTVTGVDGAQACALELTRAVRAASGHQLLLVMMSSNPKAAVPEPGLPECQDSNSSPPAACTNYDQPTIVIGGQSTPLQSVPGSGDVLAASVPDGAPAELQMNDGGRPQDIDLRTGLRTSEVSNLYYPVPQQTLNPNLSWSWNVLYIPALKWWAGDGSGPTLSDLDLTVGNGTALLEPYMDSPGWAPAGQAWLVMSFQLSLDASVFNVALNVPSSFSLLLPDGASVPASGTATTSSPSTASLVFQVPDTTLNATLRIQPVVQQWTECSGCGTVSAASVPPGQPDGSDTVPVQLGA
jgi:hypothetical protein